MVLRQAPHERVCFPLSRLPYFCQQLWMPVKQLQQQRRFGWVVMHATHNDERLNLGQLVGLFVLFHAFDPTSVLVIK